MIKRDEIVPKGWEILHADQLLNTEFPKQEFLIDKLLPEKGITILSGNPGSGKSWLLLEIVRSISSNDLLFGRFPTKEAKILIIDEESIHYEVQRRCKMLGLTSSSLPIDFMIMNGFKLDNDNKRKALLELCEIRKYKLLVFDSLRDINGLNENDSTDMQKLIDYFREFIKKDVTILISHHNRKENSVSGNPTQILRGSTAIWAGLDSLICVKSKETNDGFETIILHPKLRQGQHLHPFRVRLKEKNQKMKFEFLGEAEKEITKIEKCKEAILVLLAEKEYYRTEIIETLLKSDYSEKTIGRAIEELHKFKTIKSRSGQGNRKYYYL